MSEQPVVAGKASMPVDVVEGKTYYWCSCGKSEKQPFCDGKHKGGAFSPTAWTAPATATVRFCACKASGKAPLCDGSHKALV